MRPFFCSQGTELLLLRLLMASARAPRRPARVATTVSPRSPHAYSAKGDSSIHPSNQPFIDPDAFPPIASSSCRVRAKLDLPAPVSNSVCVPLKLSHTTDVPMSNTSIFNSRPRASCRILFHFQTSNVALLGCHVPVKAVRTCCLL